MTTTSTAPTDRIELPRAVEDAALWQQIEQYLDGADADRRAALDQLDMARRDGAARALAHIAGELTDRAQAVPHGPRAAGLTSAAIATLAFRDAVLEQRDGVL